MAQFTVNRAAVRPVQELQVPRQVGRPLRRRHQQGGRAQAHDRGGRAPRGRRPVVRAASRPGRTKYEAITLERGVTHDTEFETWANKVWNFGSGLGAEVSLKDFRKDVIIEVYNEAGPARALVQGLPGAGSRSTRRCPTSTRTRTPSRSRHQARERRVRSATTRCPSPASRSSPSRKASPDRESAGRRDARPLGGSGTALRSTERSLALAAAAGAPTPVDELARLPLGRRDALLLGLRAAHAGPRSTRRRRARRAASARSSVSTRASCCAARRPRRLRLRSRSTARRPLALAGQLRRGRGFGRGRARGRPSACCSSAASRTRAIPTARRSTPCPPSARGARPARWPTPIRSPRCS